MLDIDYQPEDFTEIMIQDIFHNMENEVFLETPTKLGDLSAMITYNWPIHSCNEPEIDVRCKEFRDMMECKIIISNISLDSEEFRFYIDTKCVNNFSYTFYQIYAEYCFKMAYIQVKINDQETSNYLGAGIEFTRNKDHIYKEMQKLFMNKRFMKDIWHHFLTEIYKLKYAIDNNILNTVIWTPRNQEQNLFRIPIQYFPQIEHVPYKSFSKIEKKINKIDGNALYNLANLLTKSLPIHSASESAPNITIIDDLDFKKFSVLYIDSPLIRANNGQKALKISIANIAPESLQEDHQLLTHYYEFLFKYAFYNFLTTYFVFNNYDYSYSILLNEDLRLRMFEPLMDESFVYKAGRVLILYLHKFLKCPHENLHWEFSCIPPIPQYNNLLVEIDEDYQIVSYENELDLYISQRLDS